MSLPNVTAPNITVEEKVAGASDKVAGASDKVDGAGAKVDGAGAKIDPTQNILDDFKKIVVDMVRDILRTFPEQDAKLNLHLRNLITDSDDEQQSSLKFVYAHCKTVFPTKFFDILYQNATNMFSADTCDELLPGMFFNQLWSENIGAKTRETIWKYLQLILFTIVSSVSDKSSFGETTKLFEAINENEFKAKLEETMADMHKLFSEQKGEAEAEAEGDAPAMPNPQDMHEHIANMMKGKLGTMAREIAEETAADLNINMENVESVNDVFKNFMQNPTKLLGLIKNVGSKLDEKLKTGDMKESDLLKEASELMEKMKSTPGMGNLQEMLSKMGMGNIAGDIAKMAGGSKGSKSKVNVNAMQGNLSQRMKAAKYKERLQSKLNATKLAQLQAQAQQAQQAQQSPMQVQVKAPLQVQAAPTIFSKGEAAVRSTPEDKPVVASSSKAEASSSKAEASVSKAEPSTVEVSTEQVSAKGKKHKKKNKN